MQVALCTPVNLRELAPYLGMEAASLPAGMGSTAITPLVAALIERGHQVTVFTLSRDVEQEVSLRGPRLTAFVGPSRQEGRARNLWKNEIDFLRHAIRREQPAFVHAHWTYEFALGALRSGVPTLTTIHDLPWNVLRYFHDPYRAARLLLAYAVACRGSQYSAVSNDAAQHFRRYFRPRAHITVVPNFLSDEVFAMGQMEVPTSHPLTFCTLLQGWTNRKNGRAALIAFQLTRKRLPLARLLMIGEDYQTAGPAHIWARQHGLDQGVEFRGQLPYRKMLGAVHAEADVLVHPSLDESFSMAALECMALRKPVIAGIKTPGVREVLDYGRAGLLVNVRNPVAIADAMKLLGSDVALREQVAAAAYASASLRFRVEPVLVAYEALYQQLAANARLTQPRVLQDHLHDDLQEQGQGKSSSPLAGERS